MPGIRVAARRGPSLKASPWIEWPAAGTAGLASVADAVGRLGSSPADTAAMPSAAASPPTHPPSVRIDDPPILSWRNSSWIPE